MIQRILAFLLEYERLIPLIKSYTLIDFNDSKLSTALRVTLEYIIVYVQKTPSYPLCSLIIHAGFWTAPSCSLLGQRSLPFLSIILLYNSCDDSFSPFPPFLTASLLHNFSPSHDLPCRHASFFRGTSIPHVSSSLFV